MNSHDSLKRRDFLAASGAFTVAAWAGGFSLSEARAADAPKGGIAQVLHEMEARGEKFLTVMPGEGRFLKMLVGATRAKNILEIGTAEGYGTLWLAAGAAETAGRITTMEIVPERVAKAKANLAKAGAANRISFHEGDAHEIAPKLDGPFDFVFLDADKDGQVDYFNKLFPKKLAPGAVIAAHNAITRADKMKDYLELMEKHPEFDAVIVSVVKEDGLSLVYRHRA